MTGIKKNEKGMTLVEIIVATAVFSIMTAMLFTAILYAIKANKESFYSGKEIQMQMNSAERYDKNKTLFDNKVVKYRFGPAHDNHPDYYIDFTQTTDGVSTGHPSSYEFENNNVYSYMAVAGVEDRTATYQMRFFKAENSAAFDASKGKYWMQFYNYSSTDLQHEATPNTSEGVKLYDFYGNAFPKGYAGLCKADVTGVCTYTVGLDISNYDPSSGEPLFLYGDWNNDYFSGLTSYTPTAGRDLLFTYNDLNEFCAVDANGNRTGYINIYYCDGQFMSENQMRAAHPELLG